MDPYVRDFADPLEGLRRQLEELEGFARVVPPLIEKDREELWDRLAHEPGDPDEDLIDVYSREAGPGTGGGFAKFDRTIYAAAISLGFAVFMDFLALELARRESGHWQRSTTRDDLEHELTSLTFPDLIARYKDVGIRARRMRGWREIEEIQFTRNAIIHNHGRYTRAYFNAVLTPRYPSKEDRYGWDLTAGLNDAEKANRLVDYEDIPLSYNYVKVSSERMQEFAQQVREHE